MKLTPKHKGRNMGPLEGGAFRRTVAVHDPMGPEKPIRQALYALLSIPVVLVAPVLTNEVSAQEQGAPQKARPKLEEIVVSAQKRGVVENAQDVPIAIYGFNSDMLDRGLVSDLADLGTLVPAADLPPVSPIRGYANFNIRGMGTIGTVVTEDPTVSLVIDGMPLGIAAGGVLSVFDVESAEVLAGPQGTLFGRNTTGGAVVIRTKRPSGETGGRLDVGAGSFGHREVSGALETANSNGTLAGRVAFKYQENDDIFDNVVGEDVGENEFFLVRPSFSWDITEALNLTVIAEAGKEEGDGPAGRNIFNELTLASQQGYVPPSDKFDLALNDPNTNDLEWSHIVAELNYDMAGGVLTSVTGFRELEQVNEVDSDGSSLSIFNFNPFVDQSQVSQELRWSGPIGEKTNLTAGAYYFSQELNYKERRRILGANGPALQSKQDHDQWALFAQGDYALTNSVNIIAGLRYTRESKDALIASFGGCTYDFSTCVFDQDLSEDWENLGSKIGVNWRISDEWMTYASWTRGFRSGGFNGRNPNPQTPAGPFGEESVDAFEVGSKLDFLDGSARLNVAAYYNDFEDLQRTILDSQNLQTVQNAASATISGVEVDVAWSVTDRLTLSGGFSYVDADYDEFQGLDVDFPADGVPDPDRAADLDFFNVAKYSASATAEYGGVSVGNVGELSARLSAYWKDDYPSNIANRIIYDPTLLLKSSVTLYMAETDLEITVYGENLTNEQYGQGAAATGLFYVDFIAPPRSFGAKLTYRF